MKMAPFFLNHVLRNSGAEKNIPCFGNDKWPNGRIARYRRNRLDVHRLMSVNLIDRECNRLMSKKKIWRHLADGQYFNGYNDNIILLGFLWSYHIENEED